MKDDEKIFIKKNSKLWSIFLTKTNGKKILFEKPSIPEINYVNSIFAIVLNQSKSYTPIWIYSNKHSIELFKSYVSSSKYIKPPLLFFSLIKVIIISILKFLNIYKTNDIISISYDNVKYGDIIYDTYLTYKKVATIKKPDLTLLAIIITCFKRHEEFKTILKNDNFDGVFVSHHVNIHSGVLLRTAIRYGYKGYVRSGASELLCIEKLEDISEIGKPPKENIKNILINFDGNISDIYKKTFEENLSGKFNFDHANAYSKNNIKYLDRNEFNRKYNLNINKKNVFVMMHIFNDSPHSHYNGMIFKDYYDWLEQTILIAKQNNNVNWIFKQHPSINVYPTLDVSYELLFSNIPNNIIYIDENHQVDTRILKYCADVIVTCAGSAGFELPAMAGIPSIVAGDNYYTGLSFAIEPKTEKEYFSVLKNIENIKLLTPNQQKLAQAYYLYLYLPKHNFLSIYPSNRKDDSFDNIYQTLLQNKDIIKKEIDNYALEISKPNFKQMVGNINGK